MATTQEATTNGTSYRRLAPVADAAERTAAVGTQVLEAAKQKAPASLQPRLESAQAAALPMVHRAQEKGASVLKAADERIDRTLVQASQAYTRNSEYLSAQLEMQRAFHAANLETYRAAREAYLKKVEDAVEYMKARGVAGAARDAAYEVLARVGEAQAALAAAPARLLHKVQEAVDRLLAYGPVSSAVQAAQPTLSAARGRYMAVHDSVLATKTYSRTYGLAADIAARAQQTWLFSKAAAMAPPAVVDTAVPYYNSLVAHLQPIEA